MPQPRLTVAIPTYNRAPFLAQTLDAFARELQRAPATGVNFLIIDNCSTDDTRAVVDRFAATVPDVAYARNETNTGAERNIMACALTSPGSSPGSSATTTCRRRDRSPASSTTSRRGRPTTSTS